MPLVTVDATVLQAFPYSETSKILRLLTAEHGVQSVIAKGARRPKSRFGGVLEPFTDGTATFYLKDTRDLHTLREFELDRPRQPLGRELVRFGAASLLAEIVLRTGSGQPSPRLFHRLRTALTELETVPGDRVEELALAHAWALVTTLGFGPALDHCVHCGARLPPERDLFFDYGAGGVLCGECGGGGGGGRVLPAAARADLASLMRGDRVALGRTGAHWQLLSRFLAYHLVDAGALRSL
ncbi:MAG: DNA repair protein RecO, partial [Gemmatimonadetes bacterium]|nr:DNA repair protein RecO [Gemmatimonadota bacterium]NIQ52574.1 DNA repair protein RecO [Gemmatimonadota bacterium]NIU72712.1 DNA repair protein RecO [Gammaproteobacteria bacterium]NIX43118.1 DNA repair protein RecO [Gemmatimonadota bacterium]NIY07280.1 DNA repair protein RecO [Gemmatimonadota bacterium]